MTMPSHIPHTAVRLTRFACVLALLLSGIGIATAAGTGPSASTDKAIAHVLDLPAAPPGVVFEIASGDEQALDWAIPAIRRYAARLRTRFPGLAIAVVTHGREQFALQDQHRKDRQQLHTAVQSLVKDDSIALHVCETYANHRGVTAEDFPAYVDVAAEGPAQIQNYEALGYLRIRLRAR